MADTNVLVLQAISDDGGGVEGHILDLEDWLRGNNDFTVARNSVAVVDSAGTRMSFLAILLLILGTNAAVAGVNKLGDALVAWIQARRPKIKIIIRNSKHEVVIETSTVTDPKQLSEQIYRLLA